MEKKNIESFFFYETLFYGLLIENLKSPKCPSELMFRSPKSKMVESVEATHITF